MDIELSNLSSSSDSDILDDEFYSVRQGDYVKFDSFDDIKMIKSGKSQDEFPVEKGEYFKYESYDNVVILNPDSKTNSSKNYNTDKKDVNENMSPYLTDFVAQFDKVLQELKVRDSNPSKTEKISHLTVFRKRLTNDFSKFTKRLSFQHKLKSEKYSGIFRRKSKRLHRTLSVPKIVVYSPQCKGNDIDSGNDSDTSDDAINIITGQMDRSNKWSSNQKLHLRPNKKAMRKSI